MITKIKAKRLDSCDHFDRPLAKDAKGNMYCDVAMGFFGIEDWHAVTECGEPNYPVKLDFNP